MESTKTAKTSASATTSINHIPDLPPPYEMPSSNEQGATPAAAPAATSGWLKDNRIDIDVTITIRDTNTLNGDSSLPFALTCLTVFCTAAVAVGIVWIVFNART